VTAHTDAGRRWIRGISVKVEAEEEVDGEEGEEGEGN